MLYQGVGRFSLTESIGASREKCDVPSEAIQRLAELIQEGVHLHDVYYNYFRATNLYFLFLVKVLLFIRASEKPAKHFSSTPISLE